MKKLDQGALCVTQSVSFQSGVHDLQGTVFRPTGDPKAIAVINGALGVSAKFYSAFASWLAETRGVAALIYDYRDFGTSASKPISQVDATMSDWGLHDAQSARDFAVSLYPDAPLWVIGHSLGAICIPFQKRLDQISRVIAIGSGATYVNDHPWPFQALARLLWSRPMHALASALGYMPGRALRLGSDVPLGVYRQWRRWSTNPNYMMTDVGTALPKPDMSELEAAVTFVEIGDDELVPPRAIARLMEFFGQAQQSHILLKPQDFNLPKIGHIAVFSKSRSETWDAIVA